MNTLAHSPGMNWRWQNGYLRVQYSPYMPFTTERFTSRPYLCFEGGSCVMHMVTLEQACRKFKVKLEDAVVTP